MSRRDVRRLIEHYFHRGFQNQVMVDFLDNRLAVSMSLSTLKRWFRDYGLSRRGVDVGDHEVRESYKGKYLVPTNFEVTEQRGTPHD